MAFSDGFVKGASVRNARDKRRQEAENRNQELHKQGYEVGDDGSLSNRENGPAELAEQMAGEAIARSKALLGRVFKTDTANAFEEFSLSGDATYLNSDLNSDPAKKAAWAEKGVLALDNINFDRDTSMLNAAGFNLESYDTPEKQDILKKSAYKYYDGKDWKIGLASKAMAETGSGVTLGKRRAKPSRDNHKQLVDLMGGPKSSPYTAEGHKYQKGIESASKETGVPANLISAIMSTESSNNPDAVSSVRGNDYTGLMQIGEAAAKDVGISDRNKDPDTNIMAGSKYLAKMLDRYNGDVPLALAAYNAGPANVDKYGGIPPFSETQNYVKKVTDRLDKAETFYGNSAEDIYASLLKPKEGTNTAYDRFLAADRDKAAASQGKTVDQVSRETEAGILNKVESTKNIGRSGDQTDRQLDQADKRINIDTLKTLNKSKELASEVNKPTKDRKKHSESEQIEIDLYESNGGYDNFMAKDMEVGSKLYTKSWNSMIAMEDLTGMKPSDSQIKELGKLRVMGTLFKDASGLTKEQTGFIDVSLKGISNYLDDNMVGGKASAAYHTIRNIYIHSLAGTAQSESEAKRIIKSYGDDYQAFGPAMTQLSGVLTQKIAELDSVMRNMHPVSAKMRAGADMASMQKTKAGMQNLLGYMEARNKYLAGKGPDPDSRPSLSDPSLQVGGN